MALVVLSVLSGASGVAIEKVEAVSNRALCIIIPPPAATRAASFLSTSVFEFTCEICIAVPDLGS